MRAPSLLGGERAGEGGGRGGLGGWGDGIELPAGQLSRASRRGDGGVGHVHLPRRHSLHLRGVLLASGAGGAGVVRCQVVTRRDRPARGRKREEEAEGG